MLCLSSYGSLKLVERLFEDYDVNVQFWSDELLESLKVVSASFAVITWTIVNIICAW